MRSAAAAIPPPVTLQGPTLQDKPSWHKSPFRQPADEEAGGQAEGALGLRRHGTGIETESALVTVQYVVCGGTAGTQWLRGSALGKLGALLGALLSPRQWPKRRRELLHRGMAGAAASSGLSVCIAVRQSGANCEIGRRVALHSIEQEYDVVVSS